MRASFTASVIAGAMLAASGALSTSVAAPGYLPINHQRIVPLPRADVWARLHEFLQDQGFAVTAENPVAGTIDASRTTAGKTGVASFAVCDPHLFWRSAQAKISLTILVAPSYDGTKVTVNAVFLDIGQPRKKGVPSFACTSTGVLETAILDVAAGQPMESAVIPK